MGDDRTTSSPPLRTRRTRRERRTFLSHAGPRRPRCFGVATTGGRRWQSDGGESFRGRRWSDDHPLPNAGASVVPVGRHARRVHADREASIASTPTRVRRRSTAIVGVLPSAASSIVAGLHAAQIARDRADRTVRDAVLHFQSARRRSDQHDAMDRRQPAASAAATRTAAVGDASRSDVRGRILRVDRARHDSRGRTRPCSLTRGTACRCPSSTAFRCVSYVPDLYGMKQPKWIVRHRRDRDDGSRAIGSTRGWSKDGRVSTVGDRRRDRLAKGRRHHRGGRYRVRRARGISSVDVRVDEGEWHAAKLRRRSRT